MCSQLPCLTPLHDREGEKREQETPSWNPPDFTKASTQLTTFTHSPVSFLHGGCLGDPQGDSFTGLPPLGHSATPSTPPWETALLAAPVSWWILVIGSLCSRFLQQAASNSHIPLRGELSGYAAQPTPAQSVFDPCGILQLWRQKTSSGLDLG